jgi:uncharacterized protein (DUF983 family)
MATTYSAELQRIRRLRLAVVFGIVVIGLLIEGALPLVLGQPSEEGSWVDLMVATGVLATVVIGIAALAKIKCPRCAQSFFQKSASTGWLPQIRPFATRCLNCQLPTRPPREA